MMKLDIFEKDMLKMLKAEFKAMGGKFGYVPESGATVAVLPHFKNSQFVQVATAYADLRDDTFKKKCGQYITLQRLNDGESTIIKRCDRSDDEIALDVLQAMVAEYF